MGALKLIPEIIQQSVENALLKFHPHKEWLTIKEACAYANCSKAKLNQLIEAGEIIASNKGTKGVTVSISKSSINEYHSRNIYLPKEQGSKANFLKHISSRRSRSRKAQNISIRIPEGATNSES